MKKTDEEKLDSVIECLINAGYNPYDQIYGFVITKDDIYITRQGGARKTIKSIDTNVLKKYLNERKTEK
jgi:uncharacterized protein (UPF0297 family)